MPYQWSQRTHRRTEEFHLTPTYQGATYKGFLVTVKRKTSHTVEIPWDLTGAQNLLFTIRSNRVQGPILYQAELGAGITMVDALQGQFTIDSFLANFPPGTHHHDVWLIDATDRRLMLLVGTLLIYYSRTPIENL